VRAAARNLGLATLAFALCFTAWSLIAPFAKTFKHDLYLSYTEALLLTAVPVVLGSLLPGLLALWRCRRSCSGTRTPTGR
jgi:nitrate/nitrite transporter NarK